MSKDPTTVICPITFIEKDPKANDSINSLFINGYNTKIVSDFTHSLMCDSIKSQVKDFNDPDYNAWEEIIRSIDHQATIDSIMAYLVSNITELCYQTIIRFLSETFTTKALPSDQIKEVPKDENGEYYKSASDGEMVGTFMRDINIEFEVTNAIGSVLIPFIKDGFTAQQIYVALDMCMDSIYSMLLVKVFNRFVNDHVNESVIRGSIDRLYELLFVECYGEPEDHNINIPSPEVEYAFCSSILREKMENALGEFRCALALVSRTASCMIVNSSEYASHLLDRNYDTNRFLSENNYAQQILKISKSDEQ